MKRLPFFTPSQRRALLILEWVLLIGIIIASIVSWKRQGTAKEEGKAVKGARTEQPAKQYTYAVQEEPLETFPFDPNTADSTTLLRLGLAPWQVRSIYRYRAKHGRYHTPEDFMRVPGMTNEQWERLKPNIRIARKFQYVEASPPTPLRGEGRKESQTLNIDTIQKSPSSGEGSGDVVKLLAGQTVDINTADTSLLKMIPGIASKRAARIVAYRRALGGFVSIEQAMEAIEMPDSVLNYMTVSSLPVQKININKLSVQQMMKHPYLNFYQAKAIFEHRRNKGELHSIEELSRLETFKATDIDRLQPYIEF